MAMTLLHPPRRRIERWKADPHPGRIEHHLAGCDRCSAKLGNADGPRSIATALERVLSPPADATGITIGEIGRRERRTRFSIVALLQKWRIWLVTGTIPPDPEHHDDG
jgi:hypothetical protein